MKCPICGKGGRILITVAMSMDSSDHMKVSKKAINKKSSKIHYVNWHTSKFICDHCGHIEKGL